MDALIGFILGLFIGAAIGLFIGAIIIRGGEFDSYTDGFNDGMNFIKNKNFDNKERRQ